MTSPPPRRRPSSATPTPRPHRLAGQGSSSPERPKTPPDDAAPPEDAQATGDAPPPDDAGSGGLLSSARTTLVLAVVIVLLALGCLAGGGYLLLRDEEPGARPAAGSTAPDGDAALTISPDDARVAVAAAAQAAYTIVATSHEDYDAQVDEAAALMTTTFAEEYRQTAEDVRDDLVTSKTEVQVSVVAQGAVSANDTEVRALVFLNQFVTKNGKDPVFTPYRALVTVVNSDDGWLVADLETA